MGTTNESNVAFIYKRKYSGSKPGDMAMRDHPTMKSIKKNGDFRGTSYTYAIRSGNPQGISQAFATAQTNASASVGLQLQMFRKKKYGIIRLDGEAMLASENDGAFLNLVTTETNGIIEEHGDTLSFECFRDGTQMRGEVASISGDVVTLTASDDVRNFKVGMVVGAATDNTYGTVRVGTTAVTSVSEDGLTIGLDVSDITGLAAGDEFFRAGADGTGAVEGFALHLPLVAPTSGDSFRGVDRSIDTRRFAGVRVDDTGTTIEENAGLVAVKIAQTFKRAGQKVLVLNPINFYAVSRRMDAKIDYTGGGVKATIGFEGFDIATAAGVLRAVSDPDCPVDRGYVLDLDTWVCKTLGEYVHLIKDDKGGPSLRVYNEDSIEARTRSMSNLYCTLPGANGVFSI